MGSEMCIRDSGRATYRFEDRFGIHRVVLAPFHVGFDLASRNELHIMAELAQLASPMMGRTAGLHADDAWWKRLKEGQSLRAFEGLVEDTPGPSLKCRAIEKHPWPDQGRRSLLSLGGSFPSSQSQLHCGTFDAWGAGATQLIRLGPSITDAATCMSFRSMVSTPNLATTVQSKGMLPRAQLLLRRPRKTGSRL